MSELNENIIPQIAEELEVECEAVERFLESETGCYADIDGKSIWMSGQLIARIIAAVT